MSTSPRRGSHTIVWSVLLLVATSCTAATQATNPEPDPSGPTASAHRIIDGDSLELNVGGEIIEARMIGINTPEFDDCQGPAARDALAAVIEDQPLGIEEFGEDRFGRLLVELSVDGNSVNEALVRAGWALALHGDERNWTAEMAQAADGGLGMWDAPDLCPPPEHSLQIVDIEPDPPGPDGDVLDQEWVEIENTSPVDQNLMGWVLRDESSSNRFEFGDVTLSVGQRLKLRTGCGDDSATDIYWCSSNGVWSNRGETALLLAPSGAIADYRFIG